MYLLLRCQFTEFKSTQFEYLLLYPFCCLNIFLIRNLLYLEIGLRWIQWSFTIYSVCIKCYSNKHSLLILLIWNLVYSLAIILSTTVSLYMYFSNISEAFQIYSGAQFHWSTLFLRTYCSILRLYFDLSSFKSIICYF